MVRDSDRGEDALDDWGDGGIGVSFNSGVSEVTTKTVGLDDGAIVSGSADEGGSGDDVGIGGSQANQKDSDLFG